ncbi:MAG: hypothetical protein JSR17_12745 [Proteobacteria bacterium]|nr:hypothetical protein [Pseudomonadota bacterium]
MINSPQAASSKKKKKKKKSKIDKVSEFILEASGITSSLNKGDYAQLNAKYPINDWLLENKLTIEKIATVIKQKASIPSQVGPAFNYLCQEMETINVLHSILISLNTANKTSQNVRILRYVLWHCLMEIYSQHTEAVTMVGILPHEMDYLKDALIHYYTLIEHYDPQFNELISDLISKQDKQSAAQYTQSCSIGIWQAYISWLNIEHYHAVFLIKMGMLEKVPAVLARLQQKITLTDGTRIKAIHDVNGSKFDSDEALKSVADNYGTAVALYKATKGMQEQYQLPTVDDFTKDIAQCDFPAQVQDKSLFTKYEHLFNENLCLFSLEYIVAKAMGVLEEPAAKNPQALKKIQKSIHLLHFALTHLVNDKTPGKFNQQYLSYLIVTLLSKGLTESYHVLMQKNAASTRGHYLTLSRLMEDNFALFGQYRVHVQALFEFLLKTPLTGEMQIWYSELKPKMLESYFNQLLAMSRYCQFNFALCRPVNIKQVVEQRQTLLNYLRANQKKLVQICQHKAKEVAQKLKDHEGTQASFNKTIGYLQKSGRDALKTFDDAIVKLLDAKGAATFHFAQRSKVAPKALNESILRQYKTASFDENLPALVTSTIYCLNALTGTFDDFGDAQVLFGDAQALCRTWEQALDHYVNHMTSEYIATRAVHVRILIERVQQLAKYYDLKRQELAAHRASIPARELIEPMQLVCYPPIDPQYKKIYLGCQGKYFNDQVTARKTIDGIVTYVETSPYISQRAKFNVLHFLLNALPKEHFDKNYHLICLTWDTLENIVKDLFEIWSKHSQEISNSREYYSLIVFYLAMAAHYKNIYQMLLHKVLKKQEKNDAVLARIKGNLFKSLFSFHELKGIELRLNFETGDIVSLRRQIREAMGAFEAFTNTIAELEAFDGELTTPQRTALQTHWLTLRELSDKVEGQDNSPDALLYQSQIGLAQVATQVLEQLTTSRKLAGLHPVHGQSTPLMILENMRNNVAEPDAQAVVALTHAFQRVLAEPYLFEASFFLEALVEVCNHWSVTLKEGAQCHLRKMASEKFQEISFVCANALPRLSVLINDTLEDEVVASFVEEVGAKEALLCDKEYPELLVRYKDTLFASRPQVFLAISRIIYQLKQSQDVEKAVNVAHFINSYALIKLQEEHGPLKVLSQQVLGFFWENLLYCYSSLSENMITKKIKPGTYVETATKLERLILLRNIYSMSISALQLEWFRVHDLPNTANVILMRWMFAEIVYSFTVEYVYALIAQGDLKTAKGHYEQAKALFLNMKTGPFGIYEKQLNDLEKHIHILAPYFAQKPPQEIVMLQVMGLLVKKCEQFEGEFCSILESLTKAPAEDGAQDEEIDLEKNTKGKAVHSRFVLFLNNCLQLREPRYRRHAPAIVKQAIDLLKKYKDEFSQIEHERLKDSIIIELLSEKIDALVLACEKVLPNIVVPYKEQVKVEEHQVNAKSGLVVAQVKRVRPKAKVQIKQEQEQPVSVVVKKEPTLDEQVLQQIKELILDAQDIPADRDNVMHSGLFEKYSALSNKSKTINIVIKFAFNELDILTQKSDAQSKRRCVNLAHFTLQYFALRVANNNHIKRNLIDYIWGNLRTLILLQMSDCMANKFPLGQCTEVFENLTQYYDLYQYYEYKSEVRKDRQRYILLPEKIIEELAKYQEGVYGKLRQYHREMVLLFNDPEYVPQHGHATALNFNAYRDFSNENVMAACKLFLNYKPSRETIDKFVNLLEGWRSVLHKGKLSFADKLVVEKLLMMMEDCKEVNKKQAVRKPKAEKRSISNRSPELTALQEPQEQQEDQKQLDDVEAQMTRLTCEAEDPVVAQLTEVTEALNNFVFGKEEVEEPAPELTFGKVVFMKREDAPSPTKQKMASLVGEITPFKPRERKEIILENAESQLRQLFSLPAFKPVHSIFTTLRERGIKVSLTGGFLRDFLLSKGTFHDYDIRAECSVEEFCALYPGAYQPMPTKRPDLVRLHELDDLGLRHDIVCSTTAYEPDFRLNGLKYDGLTLEDPFDGITDIFSPTLRLIGNSEERFKDPALVLRSIRLMNASGKYLEEEAAHALIKNAPLVTSLEIGLYITNLAALFLRSHDQAMANLNTLIQSDMLSCLLPVPLCEDPYFRRCVIGGYLHQAITKIYAQHTHQGCVNLHYGTPYYKQLSYKIVALCLLPLVISEKPNALALNSFIDQVVEHYCNNYAGFRKRYDHQNQSELDVDKEHAIKRLSAELRQLFPKKMLSHIAEPAQQMVTATAFTPLFKSKEEDNKGAQLPVLEAKVVDSKLTLNN